MTALIKFFINQHKAVNLLVLLIISVGVFTFIEGRKEGFPNLGLDTVIISTSYPGASAENVESLITRKIEDEIDSIEGAKRITSFSSEGLSIIRFEIDSDANVDNSEIVDEIKSAIDGLTFPDDANDSTVTELDFATVTPNISIAFIGNVDLEELKKVANRFKDDARKLDGVSKVELVSYPELEVWVEIIPERLGFYDIDLNFVVAAIKAQNINVPAGKIDLEGKEFFVKTTKEYESLADIQNTIIRGNDSGNYLLLKDIASVRWGHEDINSYRRALGTTSIWLNIFKAPQGDTIKVTQRIKDLLTSYDEQGLLPANVTTATSDDVAFYVKRRLNVLSSNATVGLLLVFVCMILFFSLRVTLWTMLGIPFSFCLAIIIAYSLGMTINLMTMFGLIIVVGMVVDDAIIIAENIYAHIERGEPFYDAAVLGTREMLLPVIAIVMTTTLAFLPLVTLPGIFGDVLGIIPQIIIITMLCSLVECLFILPGHLAHIKDKRKKAAATLSSPSTAPAKPTHRRWFIFFNNLYEKVLITIVKRPVMTAGLFLFVLIGVAFYLGRQLPFVFFPGNAESVFMDIETAPTNNKEATQVVIDTAEQRIRTAMEDEPYVINIVSTIGQDSVYNDVPNTQSYIGFVRIILDSSRTETDEEIAELIEAAAKDVPGIDKYKLSFLKGGPPAGKPIDVYVSGGSITEINEGTGIVYDFIKTLPNTKAHATTYQEGKREITVNPNASTASQFNVQILDIANSIRHAYGKNSSTTITSLSNFSFNDDEVELIVKYRDDDKKSISDIQNTPIRNQLGIHIPLKSLSDIEFTTSSVRLVKEDGDIYISVNALLKDPKNIEYNANVLNALVSEEIPKWSQQYPNLNFEIKGEQEEQQKLTTAIIRALLLSMFGIYFVLTVIFRSYVQPLIIMSIIPIGFIGIIIGLYLTSTPIGLMPFLGGVALMGIVVNDSLVMIDKINRLRRQNGLGLHQAVIAGAKTRMRPILMTSITTVVGIAPLAYGLLGEEPFLAPMGIALMWGIIISTLLLLVLLPAVYIIVDKIMTFIYKILGKKYNIADEHLS